MPEYLSPGPYVEEIDSGSKPIENASTSTAAMVGLTQRGPANIPLLMTNTGDYAQMFGGLLDRADFGDRGHLPLAVDGFFRNGGRRLYVTRILSASAAASAMLLYNRGELVAGTIAPSTALLVAAHTADTRVTVMEAAGITGASQRIRIGGGSRTEWHEVSAVAAAAQNVVVDLPLSNPSAGPAPVVGCVQAFAVSPAAAPLGGPHAILEPAGAGSQTLLLQSSGADLTTINPASQLLELRRNGPRELVAVRTVTALGSNVFRIALTNPLALTHPTGGTANVLALGAMTAHDASQTISSGDVCIFYGGAALGAGEIIEVVSASGAHEFRRQGQPGRITLARPLNFDLPHLARIEHLVPADASVGQLHADAAAEARTITVSDRTSFSAGAVLRVGTAADTEFVTIAVLPGLNPVAVPDPGPVLLTHGLAQAHHAAEQVALQNPSIESTAGGSVVIGGAARGDTSVLTTDIAGYTTAPGALRSVDGNGIVRVIAITAVVATAAQTFTLSTALTDEHGPGATVSERRTLLGVEALDAGSWGDRLRISTQDENSGLVSQAFGTGMIGPSRIVVSSLAGMEAGTLLGLYDATGQVIEPLLKVTQTNPADSSITLDSPLLAPQIAALGAPGARLRLRSREFRLMVTLLQQPSPAQPWRSDAVEDTEVFRQLSMDPRHSRYVEKVVGQIGGPIRLYDRRPEGESMYIRVRDTTPGPAVPGAVDPRWAVRLGPEPLVDIQPSGLRRPARHRLTGGDDGLAMLTDLDYLGQDDRDPVNRRGIPAMKNVDEISIVAVPGIVSEQVQGALVGHCEERRYCFAVLDGPAPPNDAIADVQALRQNFDTRHAAVYYPWLTIPDPMPGNLSAITQIPIPPSGHMLGIYARTDIERGVHKAPANEVVRGITGLRHFLNKSEQDILNPYPSNINVIRDFRPDNRAIRVWGARVITSDPDYKYVSVRRLMLFIEKSIERNMNWVVFEPNDEPLWSRLRLAITGFLTTLWHNGALQGTSADQAFTVKCDRSTMTQTDIDNGRLICVVGVAAVKPAEFVIIRIGLKAATTEE
ncbi:phage tail sheath family protein [Bradyrhizobium niftali]|uniref:Phage tail protein n=1 Tax=Bradyrhizobium niftali TaxID=2560055 RepID=A0A4Y9M3L7_9BRAD|nr:phage tail sheath C-terminal domain-containing protein [Bradyrhizobium niftali]TFV49637.1 hypothetical protein E4K65_05400 [Bradyrhizobium niftali]